MPEKIIERPIILGIVGDSATGKTTLTSGIADLLGKERVTILHTDDYHMYSRSERFQNKTTALSPKCNHMDILEQHLKLLRRGKSILKPIYNHSTGTLDRPVYLKPNHYIIVEGLLGYSTKEMRDIYDVKIYLEPEEELRIQWKIDRDTKKRGYTEEQVRAAIKGREYDSINYIRPQRQFSDIVITFLQSEDKNSSNLDVKHLLRPTLPHPDLSAILDPDYTSGISLKLSRDADGKPVDLFRIAHTLADDRAAKVETLLWGMMPEARHLQDKSAQQSADEGVSHALLLTRLIIAYHMIKAAQGVHAY